MNRVNFKKTMTTFERMVWAVRMTDMKVSAGIPVPVRIQRDGTNIVVGTPKPRTEGSSRQEPPEDL